MVVHHYCFNYCSRSSRFLAFVLLHLFLNSYCFASTAAAASANSSDNHNKNDAVGDDSQHQIVDEPPSPALSSSASTAAATIAGGDDDNGGTVSCPAFAPFPYWLRRQCPAVVNDTRCANGLPTDVPGPPGQLNCALASAQPNACLRQMSARELLAFTKRRDPYGRPVCMLTLFYAPDCVFSAKVADTFFRVAPLLPKLRVVAVDVSAGGKGTESLISHYGISSTPVIALWQDGLPRFRLYDDYARLDTLLRVLRTHTDLRPSLLQPSTSSLYSSVAPTPANLSSKPSTDDDEHSVQRRRHQTTIGPLQQKQQQRPADDGSADGNAEGAATTAGEGGHGAGRHSAQWEPTRVEFLAQFHYLREHLGFDWYLFAAIVTCALNCVYFVLSSPKARALLARHFPRHFATTAAGVVFVALSF